MDLKEHCVEGGLLSYEFALHVVHSGSSACDHAAAKEYLEDKDQYQNVWVLGDVVFLRFLFFCIIAIVRVGRQLRALCLSYIVYRITNQMTTAIYALNCTILTVTLQFLNLLLILSLLSWEWCSIDEC